jgi:hypothetical protein
LPTVEVRRGHEFGADATQTPREADLAAHFLPFDRATLEKAVDQFLEKFEGLANELAHLHAPANLLPIVGAVAMTAIASGLVVHQRRLRRRTTDAPFGDDEAGVPDLPNSWSLVLNET